MSTFNTIDELQTLLGERLKRLRVSKNVTQAELAARAGLSMTALRNLETGRGATLSTLFRFARALDGLGPIDALFRPIAIDPLAMARRKREPQRASRPRRKIRAT